MRICKQRALQSVFLSTLILTTCGCSGKDYAIKVEGVVTLDGNPLAGATVSFLPVGVGRSASGRTDQDGKFMLTTYQTDDGALAGSYKVIVVSTQSEEKLLGRDPSTFTNQEKLDARMKMTPMGKTKAAQAKKPPPTVPAIYSNVGLTPLREEVPPPRRIELALRSEMR